MTSLRSFINAINTAISESTESISKRNEEVLKEYFYEESSEVTIENDEYNQKIVDSVLGIKRDGYYKSFSRAEVEELIYRVQLHEDFNKFSSAISNNYKNAIPEDDAKLIIFVAYYENLATTISNSIVSFRDQKKQSLVTIHEVNTRTKKINPVVDSLKDWNALIVNLRKKINLLSRISKKPTSKSIQVYYRRIYQELKEAVSEYKKLVDKAEYFLEQDLFQEDDYKEIMTELVNYFREDHLFDNIVDFLNRYAAFYSDKKVDILDFIKEDDQAASRFISVIERWSDWLFDKLRDGEKLVDSVNFLHSKAVKELKYLVDRKEKEEESIRKNEGDILEYESYQTKFFAPSIDKLVRDILDVLNEDEVKNEHNPYFKLFSGTRRYKNKTIQTLVPKTVRINYPATFDYATPNNDKEYKVVSTPVEVPLITLIPLSSYNIEKAVLTANFQFDVNGDDVHINFGKTGTPEELQSNFGKLEITLGPKESPEGLKAIIESYETYLKRQIV